MATSRMDLSKLNPVVLMKQDLDGRWIPVANPVSSGGGGGGVPLELMEEGVSVRTETSRLNFIGPAVTAAADGGDSTRVNVTVDTSALAVKANNLSDLTDVAAARTNLGLGTAAQAALTDLLTKAGNLSGLADTAIARSNLGLGSAATQPSSAFATAGHTHTGGDNTSPLRPTGAIAETFARQDATFANGLASLATGRLTLVAIWLPSGTTVTSITFVSGSVGITSSTNWWFALYTSGLALCGQTPDQTTTAWAANTVRTVNLATPFVTTYTGVHYVGIMVAATTVPNLHAQSSLTPITGIAPILVGNSSTGLTSTAPDPAAALTAVGPYPYAYVQ